MYTMKRSIFILSLLGCIITSYAQIPSYAITDSLVAPSSTMDFGQNDSLYFNYEKTQYGSTIISPKNEVNTVLKKGQAVLYQLEPSYIIPVHEDCRVKPFQELIDNGAFSGKRMRELAREDQTTIFVNYDETGIVSYVYFFVPVGSKSLLTEKELCLISQKLKTVKYDLSQLAVYRSETGSKTVFYCEDLYPIPFKDLKYQ